MRNTTFSFIIPTRQRTGRLRRLLESIRATTRNLDALEIILVVDSDDEETMAFQHVRMKRVEVAPGLSMGELNMSGYRIATGDYLMLMNDDVVLRTSGWDDQVLAAFRSYADGIVLVHVNDLFFRKKLCIFPFVTREFCRLTKGICPTGYFRYGIDNHIQNIFELLADLGHDRRIYLPDVVFEHTNFQSTGEGAPGYLPDSAIHALDVRLLDSLLEEREQVAAAAKRRIEDYRALQSPRPSKITIGILSADARSAQARKCIELVKTCTPDTRLVVADNNGVPVFDRAREMNRLLATCDTDYLVLMDDDVCVEPGWLEGMLRAMNAEVGVVTPLHQDKPGRLSYAGVVISPDDTGEYSPILEAPAETRRIQTLSSAVMLIDMQKCCHIRLDENYTEDFLGIDYGLRIWEAGFQVVCTPDAQVRIQAGPYLPPAMEEQARRYRESWIDAGRLRALRQGSWKKISELAWIGEKTDEIDRLFEQTDRYRFMQDAASLVRSVAAYPALKAYIASRALSSIGENRVRVDDPKTGHCAFLLGLTGRPVLFEADFQGSNIVLENFKYYAVRRDRHAANEHRLEAESPEELKALIRQWRSAPAPATPPPLEIPPHDIATEPSVAVRLAS